MLSQGAETEGPTNQGSSHCQRGPFPTTATSTPLPLELYLHCAGRGLSQEEGRLPRLKPRRLAILTAHLLN